MGVCTNAQAATGSLDRDNYFPSYSDTNDYDRAWISVTDSSGNTTSSQDIYYAGDGKAGCIPRRLS